MIIYYIATPKRTIAILLVRKVSRSTVVLSITDKVVGNAVTIITGKEIVAITVGWG